MATMATIAVEFKIEREYLARGLEETRDKLDSAGPEMVVDFSAVDRIDAPGLRALEDLTARADEKGVKIVLRGTNIEVYKALKLMRLASRFGFAD